MPRMEPSKEMHLRAWKTRRFQWTAAASAGWRTICCCMAYGSGTGVSERKGSAGLSVISSFVCHHAVERWKGMWSTKPVGLQFVVPTSEDCFCRVGRCRNRKTCFCGREEVQQKMRTSCLLCHPFGKTLGKQSGAVNGKSKGILLWKKSKKLIVFEFFNTQSNPPWVIGK